MQRMIIERFKCPKCPHSPHEAGRCSDCACREHSVATTCAGCGAKGWRPGPEGIVHKTIICPNCRSRE